MKIPWSLRQSVASFIAERENEIEKLRFELAIAEAELRGMRYAQERMKRQVYTCPGYNDQQQQPE